MAPSKPPLPPPAEPKYGRPFDPWNSVAAGHQRAESKDPHGWRASRAHKLHSQFAAAGTGGARISDAVGAGAGDKEPPPPPPPPPGAGSDRDTHTGKLFDGLCIYVNGSTHPLVSDHRLKLLLAEHGARMALHLGRRQVTHVILGRPSSAVGGPGAGGGLAGGKLEKEIRKTRGCHVKFVGVEWVLESIKAGRRLPEARFSHLKLAAHGQQSLLGAFSKA